ncbi:MAG: hypothetical protein IJD50_03975 [Clostridia bacterium]|nr:hypothetical protein [Clostridia bacterium]
MINFIKSEIQKLYETNPNVNISIKKTQPKALTQSTPAVINGVYRNIFQIEKNYNGHPCRQTFQYADVLSGNVIIKELNFTPITNVKK